MVRIPLRPELMNRRHLAGSKGSERTYLGLGGCHDLGPDLSSKPGAECVEILDTQ
jgi:hypothetical protein